MSINLGTELLLLQLFGRSSSCAFLFFTLEVNNGSDKSGRLSVRNSSSYVSEFVGTYPLELSCCTSLSLAGDEDDFDEHDDDDAQLLIGEVLLLGMLLLIEFKYLFCKNGMLIEHPMSKFW